MEPPPITRRTVTEHHSKTPVSLASLLEMKHYRAVVASSDIQQSCFMKIGRVQKQTGDTHFRQGGDPSGQSHRNVELASVKPGGSVLKDLGLKDFMRHTARHGRPSGEPCKDIHHSNDH